jgi:hypothetical protein
MIARRRAAPQGSSCSVIGPPFDPRTRLHDLRQFQRGTNMCRVSGDAVTIAGAVTATFGRVPVLVFASSPYSPSGSSSGPDGSANPRFDSCPGTEPTHWHPEPQSLLVVFVPLPPVSEMRLPRPWPPVFQGHTMTCTMATANRMTAASSTSFSTFATV